MGFFSKLKKKVRGQIAPVMPMAPQAPRPIGEMPLTPEQMARKAEYERNKAIENERNVISKYGSRENMERMVRDSFAGPRDFNPAVDPPFNLPSPDADGYYPGDDRYGGGFTRGPGLNPRFDPPRMAPPVQPRPIEKVYKVDPRRRKPRKGSSIRDAIRRSEQQQFTNPTMFGQPIGNFDFGNMPNFSIDDIMEMPQPIPERMPRIDDGRVYAGGSPGLYKPGGRFYNPEARLQMFQPIPRAEIDISALEPLPMGDMPNFSINDIIEMPQKPQKRSGLSGLFRRLQEQIKNEQMPQDPMIMPRTAPPVMNQMQGDPRMMMAGGRDVDMVDFLNSDPQQQIFGIETRIGMLENQLEEALANNDRQSYDMIVDQINDADAQRIELMNLPGDLDRSRDQLVSMAQNFNYLTQDEPRRPIKRRPMRKKLLDQMLENSNRFNNALRGGKDNARSPSRRDLELMEMQRQQQQARESLDDILSDLEKKN